MYTKLEKSDLNEDGFASINVPLYHKKAFLVNGIF